MHVEHINPNGDNHLNNLCLSCASCNMSKAKAISALDVENNLIVRLFNPRIDEWNIHFAWSEDGLLIIGKTSTARATISRLKMNQERLLRARANWIIADTHPPK